MMNSMNGTLVCDAHDVFFYDAAIDSCFDRQMENTQKTAKTINWVRALAFDPVPKCCQIFLCKQIYSLFPTNAVTMCQCDDIHAI